jgi:hypothetical protein
MMGRMDAAARKARSMRTVQDPDGNYQWDTLLMLAGVPVVLLAIGVASTVLDFFPGPDGGLHWMVACLGAIAIWTFVALYNDSGDIRTAIAASVMVAYFASLFVVALLPHASEAVSSGGAKTALDGFQNLVVIVVGFYITGKTVESVVDGRKPKAVADPPDVTP